MAARTALAIGRPPIIARAHVARRYRCPLRAACTRARPSVRTTAMFNRTTAWILIAALAAGARPVGRAALARPRARPPGRTLQAVKLFDQPRELPPFSLQQSDGTQLVPGELKGHWTLVFLGFTHCPDVCPTTLAQLAQAQKQWAALPDPTRPRVLFVSVDPERDTPDAHRRIRARLRSRHAGGDRATCPRWKTSRARCRWCS